MANETARFVPNLAHPAIIRAVLSGILATGDVPGRDKRGRAILPVVIEDWPLDALAALGAADEDLEPEPDEEDDPAEDGEG